MTAPALVSIPIVTPGHAEWPRPARVALGGLGLPGGPPPLLTPVGHRRGRR